jgi:hypothetical protein
MITSLKAGAKLRIGFLFFAPALKPGIKTKQEKRLIHARCKK